MPRQIPVYKAEADAGLTEVINAEENQIIACMCPVLADNSVNADVHDVLKVKDLAVLETALAINREQFDLHYLYTILASTGWNDNDDVFDRYETWAARSTAEDKPFNLQHDPNRIIGHITGNCVVNTDYELVNSNLNVDALPDKFHILTSAVIYKHLRGKDAGLTKATSELIEEINKGEWFVSMECLFANFDYAVITADGDHKIVQRTQDTAYLSKHLRVYGGRGEYQGNRVGRLMRNTTFSGKGLVKVPGNPESIIFDNEDTSILKGLAAADIQPKTLTNDTGDIDTMPENTEQVLALQDSVRKGEQLAADLTQRLKDMDEAQVTAKFEALATQVADRDTQIVELTAKLEKAEATSEESTQGLEKLTEAKANIDKQLGELQGKLDGIEAESLKTNRTSALVDKGVDKADAESIVETFVSLSDEQFEKIVATQSELIEAKKSKETPEEKAKREKAFKEKADADAAAAGENGNGEEGDAEALAKVEAEKLAALAAQAGSEEEAVTAGLQTFFSEALGGSSSTGEQS